MPEWIINYWIEWSFGFFILVVSSALKLIWNKQKAQTARQIAIEDGLRGLLHDRLYQLYTECIEKGYISIEQLDNLEYIFGPYAALKGNGTGKHMYDFLHTMPNIPANK